MENKEKMGSKSVVVPSSLLRIRLFINSAGWKIKPNCDSQEILDSFYDLLKTNVNEESFWKEVELLLKSLISDMKKRMEEEESGNKVVRNEVLGRGDYARFFEEIRSCMKKYQNTGKGRFRGFLSYLSPLSMEIFLMLTGVATVGCYSSSEFKKDSSSISDFYSETEDNTGDFMDAEADRIEDMEFFPPPPDVPPDPRQDEECEPVASDLTQMINSCISSETDRENIINCINALNESWERGLEEYFKCSDCRWIGDTLYCLLYSIICEHPELIGEFDEDLLINTCYPVPLYLGVRFD